jgi:hypothetical protein
MSFRDEFINKLNRLYEDHITKRKAIEADWGRIRGYMTSFLEEIKDVKEFACANTGETETELMLSVEGHELSFRKNKDGIKVFIDGDIFADLYPTVEGYCTNYEEKKVLDVMDSYMKLAFQGVMTELQ